MNDDSSAPIEDKAVKDRSTNATGTPNLNKFISPGILLFVDQLVVAAGNWIFWLLVSRFATTSEIGHATTIYSLVLLVNTITQLGLEYPLLKKSVIHRDRIFFTTLIMELAITGTSIPLVLYLASGFYQEAAQLAWLAIGILVLSSLSFIMRFALLGLSNAKTILVSDLIGTVVKFISAFVLVTLDYGAIGILLSILLQTLAIASAMVIPAKRTLGLSLGDFSFSKQILLDGLVNLPSKLSGMIIVSIAVILLAFVGIDSSQVGIFYIAMMISIVAGSFASSLAFMTIPASSESKIDLSSGSLRIGLAFTSPIIAILIVAPQTILSVIGKEYTLAANVLTILAIGVLPSIIVSNTMSRLNTQNRPKRIVAIGIVRIITFLIGFFLLVPQLGILGAAYAILGSFLSSAILSIIWSQEGLRYIVASMSAIIAGTVTGKAIEILANHNIGAIAASLGVAVIAILLAKCTSIKEISMLARGIKKAHK